LNMVMMGIKNPLLMLIPKSKLTLVTKCT
jgi:hypothetical protein